MKIRMAEEKDLIDLLDIYNYEVEHGTATFDLTKKDHTGAARMVFYPQ